MLCGTACTSDGEASAKGESAHAAGLELGALLLPITVSVRCCCAPGKARRTLARPMALSNIIVHVGDNVNGCMSSRGGHWIASARCAVSMDGVPARSEMAHASFRIRGIPLAKALPLPVIRPGAHVAPLHSRPQQVPAPRAQARTSSTGQWSRTSAGPIVAGQARGLGHHAAGAGESGPLALVLRLHPLADGGAGLSQPG
jgi:hypothetical protein